MSLLHKALAGLTDHEQVEALAALVSHKVLTRAAEAARPVPNGPPCENCKVIERTKNKEGGVVCLGCGTWQPPQGPTVLISTRPSQDSPLDRHCRPPLREPQEFTPWYPDPPGTHGPGDYGPDSFGGSDFD